MGAKTHSKKASKVAAGLKSPKTPKADKVAAKARQHNDVVDHLKTGLDPKLAEKAVGALLKFHEKQTEQKEKASLLGNDRTVQIQFTLLREPGNSSPKPIRIMIPHPLYKISRDGKLNDDDDAAEEPEVCLIVKEESKPWCQEMIEKFPEYMGCIKKVLGLQSLRKKHSEYAQRRELLKKYNVFMADDRILPMLSKALGKDFFKAKKLPIPICLTRKEALPFAIQNALSATFMTLSKGTCITIRAGSTAMAPEKLVENIIAIANNAPMKIPRKWANVQVISIKTPESVALPIYNKTPDVLRELASLAGIKEDMDISEKEEKKDIEPLEEETNEKKRAMQSPLLRALKQQKQDLKEKKKQETKSKKTSKSAAKEESSDDDDDDNDDSSIEQPKETTPKSSKKRSASTVTSDNDKNEEKGSAKKKKLLLDDETKHKKEAKKKATTTTTTPESSASTKKEVKKSSEPKKKKQKEASVGGADYIASKKFKGSKSGYVFKMGKKGLGYYIDEQPRVDKMAIDAILRMGKNQSRRGGQKKNKYKGTRRF